MKRRFQFKAELRESFSMAMSAIAAHKLRSALTLTGILVGVFSIILVMTALRALQNNIETEMSRLGTHTFQIQRWPAFRVADGRGSRERYLRREHLTLAQANELRERATLAKAVGVRSGLAMNEAISIFGRTNPNVELVGVNPDAAQTLNWTVELGRPLMESDLEQSRRVCLLGSTVAELLFPSSPAVGQAVKFQGIDYQVVGVLAPKGSIFGQDQDRFMAIPITTALERFGRDRSVTIQVQAYDGASFNDTIEQVRGVLRKMRKDEPGAEDSFEIFSNDSLIEQFRAFTFVVRAGAGVISSIALIAAGIGIMNIMLVSVTERTREIGIRRAVGAKRRNIMTQFVLEAIVLCQVGGALGVVLGIASGNIAAHFLSVPPVVPVDWVVLGFVICSLVGLIFGTYPAYKAAHLDPIESLRYE